jgi:hypothetical protein
MHVTTFQLWLDCFPPEFDYTSTLHTEFRIHSEDMLGKKRGRKFMEPFVQGNKGCNISSYST